MRTQNFLAGWFRLPFCSVVRFHSTGRAGEESGPLVVGHHARGIVAGDGHPWCNCWSFLPAVQAARSRPPVQCTNNLKQQGLAGPHSFHEVHHRLPPGYVGPWPPVSVPTLSDQFVGVLPHLLPHLEQQAVRDRILTEMDAQ